MKKKTHTERRIIIKMKRKIPLLFMVLLISFNTRAFAEDQIGIPFTTTGDMFCLVHSEPPAGVQKYQTIYTNSDIDGTTYISGIIPDETNLSCCLLEILTIANEKTFVTRYKVKEGDVLKFFIKTELSPYIYLDFCYLLVKEIHRNHIWVSLTDSDTYNRQFK